MEIEKKNTSMVYRMELEYSISVLEKITELGCGVSKGTWHCRFTVKPVCNDHLYDKIYYLWFIQ